ATGKVTRGRLGVGIQSLTKELAQSFKLDQPVGAVITNVEKGSPADRAGLKVGDVILSYNGKKIEDPNELPRLVAATKPREKATLEVWRDGKRQQVAATVGEFPAEAKAAARTAPAKDTHDNLGLAVSELPPEGRKALGVDYGLVVEDVRGGAAAGSGLERGDVIVAIGQDRFRSLEEFNKMISQRKGQRVPLLVRRGESALFVPVELAQRLSVHGEAAGDAHHLSGDELRVVARKEEHRAGDVLGLAQPPDRHRATVGFA